MYFDEMRAAFIKIRALQGIPKLETIHCSCVVRREGGFEHTLVGHGTLACRQVVGLCLTGRGRAQMIPNHGRIGHMSLSYSDVPAA